MGRRRLLTLLHHHLDELHEIVDGILEALDLTEGEAGKKVINPGRLCPTRRDPYSRIERRVRDKASPQKRDMLRAKRERDQRNRRKKTSGANPPRKIMGKNPRPSIRRPGL